MIISASRRTDIPAFYTPWLMNRLREQFVLTRNPFNASQVRRVSLAPADLDLIVFWTRNPSMLLPHLAELDSQGYRYYFHYTLTGYPKQLESAVPRPRRAIDTFCRLSDTIGPERVIWRYDPILLSNLVSLDEHKRLFVKLAATLAGKTRRVVISFADIYRKTARNLSAIDGLTFSDITRQPEALHELAGFMAQTAAQYQMQIETCAESLDLSSLGITRGKCIDEQLIRALFGLELSAAKDSGQRGACGCIKSVDIGAYNSCLHGCAYCYATDSPGAVRANRAKHDPHSPFLIGDARGVAPELLRQAEYAQRRLF